MENDYNKLTIYYNTIKSGIMKVFNTIGLDDMIAMNRLVAKDLEMRKDNKDSVNTFHSQGTIIGTGAFDILRDKNIRLNDDQTIKAVGPAAYKTNWDNGASQIITPRYTIISKDSPLGKPGTVIDSNIQYKHHENDDVRDVTAPRTPTHLFIGIYNLIFHIDQHGVDSYKND